MAATLSTEQEINRAAKLLLEGKLVAFPTETVYGLGADATNQAAVQSIFKAKGRPASNPLIVHVASFAELLACIDFSKSTDPTQLRSRLTALSQFWPGPLSVVVPKAAHIAPAVSAGGPSVALRIPRHPVALKLLETAKRPLAAPSANPSMYISPTTAQHVKDSLGDAVATVLDGGPCAVGIESTVLSLMDEPPRVLRPGAVTVEQLSQCLHCQVATATHKVSDTSTPLLSPGLLAKHYAPRTPVTLLSSLTSERSAGQRIGVILFRRDTALNFTPAAVRVISEAGDLNEVAARIFSSLRELDLAGLDCIAVDTCEPVGLGAAIMDRLLRATASDENQ
jgi:L-threonylcarbamoyladenylate synthase